jgi:hypothetical protein
VDTEINARLLSISCSAAQNRKVFHKTCTLKNPSSTDLIYFPFLWTCEGTFECTTVQTWQQRNHVWAGVIHASIIYTQRLSTCYFFPNPGVGREWETRMYVRRKPGMHDIYMIFLPGSHVFFPNLAVSNEETMEGATVHVTWTPLILSKISRVQASRATPAEHRLR